MASRLNQLFQVAPQSFLERTVLFTDALGAPQANNSLDVCIDIEPVNTRSRARRLPSLHSYADMPMISYLVSPAGSVLIPKEDPPHKLVFMPEFTCCRLLVRNDGDDWLRLSIEQGLSGMLPAPESQTDSPYTDSVNYWQFHSDDLVGTIRGSAVLFKEPDLPWTFIMQQIVGPPGGEVVRKTFARVLKY
jgi:hypothetical protein